jgi:magnesium transporter
MPYVAYYLSPEGRLQRDLGEDEIRQAFASKQGLLWVDICETTTDDGAFLERVFGFHHLAIEDCVSPQVHAPKIDDFDDHLFIVVHGINHQAETDIVETAELALFLGSHFVVSNHNDPLYSVAYVSHMVRETGRPMRRGADFLAHAIIDALVDNVLPTVDAISDAAESIEEEAIRAPRQSTIEAILKFKRSTLRLHRVMAPQREIMYRLSRGEFTLIGEEAQIFYRDVYDHIVRIEDLNQTLRDRADNALSTYLSSMANRQNETMRVLSMVATIFLPLALLAGIYGMNFDNMPELHCTWAYFVVLGFMALVVAGAMYWFWARNWVTWGRKRITRVALFTAEPQKLLGHITHRGRPH